MVNAHKNTTFSFTVLAVDFYYQPISDIFFRKMHFEFSPSKYPDRQSAINDFSQALKEAIRSRDNPRSFNHEQVTVMLIELAKNTFDHSSGIGLLDMQFASSSKSHVFTYSDTGHAFDCASCSVPGASSKSGNGINFGMGLAIVQSGANGAGFNLTVQRLNNATQFLFERKCPVRAFEVKDDYRQH